MRSIRFDLLRSSMKMLWRHQLAIEISNGSFRVFKNSWCSEIGVWKDLSDSFGTDSETIQFCEVEVGPNAFCWDNAQGMGCLINTIGRNERSNCWISHGSNIFPRTDLKTSCFAETKLFNRDWWQTHWFNRRPLRRFSISDFASGHEWFFGI